MVNRTECILITFAIFHLKEVLLDAEVGAVGEMKGEFKIRDLKDIKFRKKRSPGFGKRFKKSFKKVWVS